MDWSLQARSTATSPEFWSGWVLQLVHLASAENRPDVVKANVRCLHSTMKSRGALQDEPLDLTISCLNSKYTKGAADSKGSRDAGKCSGFWGRVTHLRWAGDYRGEAVAAYGGAGATGSRRRTVARRAGGPGPSTIRGTGADAGGLGRGRGVDCALGSPRARVGDAPWLTVLRYRLC